jgi:hypothetical protein
MDSSKILKGMSRTGEFSFMYSFCIYFYFCSSLVTSI